MLDKLFDLIDSFIPDVLHRDHQQLYRARLVIGILLGVTVSCLFLLFMMFLVPGLPSDVLWANTALIVPITTLWASLCLALKREWLNLFVTTQCTITSLIFILFAGISISGGPMESHVLPLLVIPIIIAFLISGRKTGITWMAISLFTFAVFSLVEAAGVSYINIPPPELRPMLKISNWAFSFLMIGALSLLYETLSSKAITDSERKEKAYKEIANMALNSSTVQETADNLSDSGKQLILSTSSQQAAIEDLAVTTEELLASAQNNQAHAQQSLENVQSVTHLLTENTEKSIELNQAMELLKQSSLEIQQINNLINEIAQQTNLLSLNAMIEASRFDDTESGFTVVANEVKNLAERSVAAVKSINTLLQQNQEMVTQGLGLAQDLQTRSNHIKDTISPIVHTSQQVAESCREQSLSIQQINGGLSEIELGTQQNEQLANTCNTLAVKLKEETESLTLLSNSV